MSGCADSETPFDTQVSLRVLRALRCIPLSFVPEDKEEMEGGPGQQESEHPSCLLKQANQHSDSTRILKSLILGPAGSPCITKVSVSLYVTNICFFFLWDFSLGCSLSSPVDCHRWGEIFASW